MQVTLITLLILCTSGIVSAQLSQRHHTESKPCPLGWELHSHSCYYTSGFKATWSSARRTCKGAHPKSDLVSVHNNQEQNYMHKKMRWDMWIGLNSMRSPGHWEWSDGSPTDFMEWEDNEPKNDPGKRCVQLYMIGNDYENDKGVYQTMSCDETRAYACKLETASCPDTWELIHGICYYVPPRLASWSRARQNCKDLHESADLASIHTLEEHRFLVGKLFFRYWTGLNSIQNHNWFEWSDGTALDFFNWQNGREDFAPNKCVEIDWNGKWKGQDCEIYRHFTCRIVLDGTGTASRPVQARPPTTRTTPRPTTAYRPPFTTTTKPINTPGPSSKCHPIVAKSGVNTRCYTQETQQVVPCDEPVSPGVEIRYSCDELYQPASRLPYAFSRCRPNGGWLPERTFTCNPICGISSKRTISFVTHGHSSDRGEWPWHAALYTRRGSGWDYHCGGTLISERSVLTAAHCAAKVAGSKAPMDTSNMIIGVGKLFSKFSGESEYAQFIEPQKFVMYPQYSPEFNQNDLAIIILKDSARILPHVRPACFPQGQIDAEDDDEDILDEYGVVAGWGRTETGEVAERLQMTQLPVIEKRKCTESLKNINPSHKFSSIYCAGWNNGTNVCTGDSGGGMVFPKTSPSGPVYYVRGVVSFGIPEEGTRDCDPTKYSYFTRVSKFSVWIVRILSEAEWGDDFK